MPVGARIRDKREARKRDRAELAQAASVTEIVDRTRKQIAELTGLDRDQIKITLTARF